MYARRLLASDLTLARLFRVVHLESQALMGSAQYEDIVSFNLHPINIDAARHLVLLIAAVLLADSSKLH